MKNGMISLELIKSLCACGILSTIGIATFCNFYSHASLTKDAKFIKLDSVSPQPKLNKKKKLILVAIPREARECVFEFLEELRGYDHIDLSNFYTNVHPYFIRKRNPSDRYEKKYEGLYYIDTAEIMYSGNIRDSIFHELLHLAANRASVSHWLCGFRQRTKDFVDTFEESYDIGQGLDEGYTQLLADRYFSKHGGKPAYKLFVNVASYIEVIVGREKMEELYFKADLYSLVEILKQYASLDEIMTFLADLDYIYGTIYVKKAPLPKVIAHTRYQRVLLILTKMLSKKIRLKEIDDRFSEALLYSLRKHITVVNKSSYNANSNTQNKIKKLTLQPYGNDGRKIV